MRRGSKLINRKQNVIGALEPTVKESFKSSLECDFPYKYYGLKKIKVGSTDNLVADEDNPGLAKLGAHPLNAVISGGLLNLSLKKGPLAEAIEDALFHGAPIRAQKINSLQVDLGYVEKPLT
ncbi:MAG: hypothetical protein GY854_23140 [Deltaproteobacteria bacterium]|nr:hypothetical protein [Deltaproteobacteria bacterium]